MKIGLISAYSEAIMEHGELFQPLLLFHPLQFWGIQNHHH
jgi:hypothetical protein